MGDVRTSGEAEGTQGGAVRRSVRRPDLPNWPDDRQPGRQRPIYRSEFARDALTRIYNDETEREPGSSGKIKSEKT